MYLVKSPWLLKQLYPDRFWNASRDIPCLYLTFDDGPIPVVTPFVLETLKRFGCLATFFCIGDNVRKHPDIFARLSAEGHAIGNHTFNHLNGWKTDDDSYLDNYLQCRRLMDTDLFRPPYGRLTRSQARRLHKANPGMRIIMWDVLSGDFDQGLSPEGCLRNVLLHTQNGSVIVFHDSWKAFERLQYVLPRALKFWLQRGYRFGLLPAGGS